MATAVAVYEIVLRSALGSLLLLAIACTAVLLLRQPARRIRVIQWTLAGLVLLPALLLVPGYPRLAVLPALSELATSSPSPSTGEGLGEGVESPNATEHLSSSPSPSTGEGRGEGGAPPRATQRPTSSPSPSTGEGPDEGGASPRATQRAASSPSPSTGEGRGEGGASPRATQRPTSSPSPLTGEGRGEGETPVRGLHIPGDFRLWILAAYGIGVVLMALWSLMGLVAVQRLLRSARPAPPECRILLRAVGGPRSDRVRLLVSSRAAQPCAVVSRSATIVLPEQLVADADPRALQWALAHEWSHVEHGDLATWTASAIVRWFYFYQPLVWWLRGQLQLSQDFVADAAAARLGETPEDYAEFLTTSSFTRPTLAAGLGIGGRIADLRRRVIMLVERRRALESRSPRRWNLLALPLAVLVLAATAGLAQEESRPEAAANKPETGGGRLEDKEPATAKDEAPAPAYEVAPFGSPPVISESVQDARSKADSLIPKTSRKPKHKQGAQPQSARIPDAMVEQELMKDQFLTSLVRERAELVIKLAKLKAKPGTAKSAINDLNAEINSLDQEIDEYKANLRPRVVELLAAEVARGQPAQDEQPLLPQPSPNVPRPQAAPPAGPRKIAPGDTLTIDVMDNVDSLKLPGLRLLMRTGATATVAGDGKLSLGSIYGNVDVAGETLDRAEASIAEKLETMTKMRYQTPKGISQDLVDDALNHMQINVRLSFANAGGPVTAAAPTRLHANTPPPPATAVSTTTILPGDVLNIDVEPPEADVSVRKPAVVEQDGNVALGVRFGRVNVGGKTLAEAEDLIEKSIAEIYRDPQVQVTYAQQGTISTAAPARRMDNDKPSHELLQEVQRLNARIDQLQKMLEKERRQHYQPYPTPTDDPLIVPSEGPNVKPPPLEPPSDDPFTPQVRPQPEDAPTRPEPKPNIEPGPAPESKPKLKPEPQPPLQPEPN